MGGRRKKKKGDISRGGEIEMEKVERKGEEKLLKKDPLRQAGSRGTPFPSVSPTQKSPCRLLLL